VIVLVIGILAAGVLMVASNASADVTIGVLARRGIEIAEERWTVLGEYLTKRMGEKVSFHPLGFDEVMDFCETHPRQFLFANSWYYVKAKVKFGAKALVTVQNRGSGTLFGGVIFTRKEASIRHLSDIRGKVLACPKFASAGGWIVPKAVLVKKDLPPEDVCKKIIEAGTHDAVVRSVWDGAADVGFVRTNILERLSGEGKIDIHDYRVLNPVRHKGFPELCSTPLYPTWPIASLRSTPPETAAKLKQILLKIPKGRAALDPCKVERFVEALDYCPLEDLLRFLKVDPFDPSEATKQDRPPRLSR
jgi:two-component system sensor histidine kinase TtrS